VILLTATTDLISVITSAATAIDVNVSFMDMTTADPPVVKGSTSGRTNTAIPTATTTTIMAAPASSTVRNMKSASIRNKSATTSNDITVQFNQNGTLFEIIKVTLPAGATLEFIEGVGWYVLKSDVQPDVRLRVTSDFVSASASFADVTGLTYPVESGKHYGFDCRLFHFGVSATNGPRFAVNGPAMTELRINALITETGSAAAAVMNANIADVTALDTAVIVTTDGAVTAPVMTVFSGWFNPSANGTFAIRAAGESAAASALTIKKGSWMHLWEFHN